jgi:uncharacterized protein YqjF (DUF2071 family)
MRWRSLALLHWPVPVVALRAQIPSSLHIDTFDGDAWIGVVPFRMSDVHPRGVPAVLLLSAMPELNVRTYVTAEGKPGVWFFSLDTTSRLAVRTARWFYHLSYFDAVMSTVRRGEWIDYRSRRVHRGAAPAEFDASYRPTGPPRPPAPGTLENFLTERYCLYSADRQRRTYRTDVAHAPWPLQRAEAELRVNRMTEQIGIALPDRAPLVHYATVLDVIFWTPEQINSEASPTP